MAKYRVTGPDGGTYEIMAPDTASNTDVMAYVQKAVSSGGGLSAAPKKEAAGTIPAVLGGLAQGATFGFADEIEGGARALVKKVMGDDRGLSDLYNEGVTIPRERNKHAADTNPYAYHGSQIAAGLLVPGGLARVGIQGAMAGAAGRGLGARTVAGIKEGSAYNAAAGAGNAEGGLENTLKGTAIGGAIGGTLGGVLPGAIDLGSSVARGVMNPISAAINPAKFATDKLAEAASRDLSRNPNASGRSLDRLTERMDDMSAVTPSARMIDAAGDNTRGLVRAATNMPNQNRDVAKRMLDARQAGQWTRIEAAADKSLAPGKRAAETVDDLITKRDAAAGPLFAKAFATDTPVTQGLLDVVQRPTMQKVGEKVALRLQDEGRTLEPAQRTEWLHRVKLELDDLIGQSKRAEVMGNTPQAGFDVKTLVTLKNDLLNSVDNPAYKHALKQFAGPSALKNAAEAGEAEFTKSTGYEIRHALAALSPSEQEMYRLGAKAALFKSIETGNVTRDRTDGVFSSPAMQARLKELFPSQQEFREFQKALIVEAKMADSRKALQGNSTTARQLTEGSQAGMPSRLVMSAVNAMLKPSVEKTMNALAQGKNYFSGITPAVAHEIIGQAMSKNSGELATLANQSFAQAAQAPGKRAALASTLMSGSAQPVNHLFSSPQGQNRDR